MSSSNCIIASAITSTHVEKGTIMLYGIPSDVALLPLEVQRELRRHGVRRRFFVIEAASGVFVKSVPLGRTRKTSLHVDIDLPTRKVMSAVIINVSDRWRVVIPPECVKVIFE